MNSGVYTIRNIINNKQYIGCSTNLNYRKIYHFCKLRKNKHSNSHLQASFNKYKEENFVFEIIELCEIDKIYEKEDYYCRLANTFNNKIGYNQRETDKNNKPLGNDLMKLKIKEGRRNGKTPEFSKERRKIHSENLKKRGWTKEMLEKRTETKRIPLVYFDNKMNYLGEIDSAKIAAKKLKLDYKMINKNLNNNTSSVSGKYIFAYKKDYLGNGKLNLNIKYDG